MCICYFDFYLFNFITYFVNYLLYIINIANVSCLFASIVSLALPKIFDYAPVNMMWFRIRTFEWRKTEVVPFDR